MKPTRDRLRSIGARTGRWYSIRTEATKATLRIYDEISYWGVSAEDLANELAAIDAAEIEVQISSPGGDAFDGLAIYNALRIHPARITTRVDGLAASAASVIVQAGDHRVIVQSAQLMIHEAWGYTVGTADEMRQFADVLEQQNEVMAEIYATRSGGDIEHIRQMMAAETWFTDQKALDEGLVDEIHTPAPAAASGDDTTSSDDDTASGDDADGADAADDNTIENRFAALAGASDAVRKMFAS